MQIIYVLRWLILVLNKVKKVWGRHSLREIGMFSPALSAQNGCSNQHFSTLGVDRITLFISAFFQSKLSRKSVMQAISAYILHFFSTLFSTLFPHFFSTQKSAWKGVEKVWFRKFQTFITLLFTRRTGWISPCKQTDCEGQQCGLNTEKVTLFTTKKNTLISAHLWCLWEEREREGVSITEVQYNHFNKVSMRHARTVRANFWSVSACISNTLQFHQFHHFTFLRNRFHIPI